MAAAINSEDSTVTAEFRIDSVTLFQKTCKRDVDFTAVCYVYTSRLRRFNIPHVSEDVHAKIFSLSSPLYIFKCFE